MTPTPLLMLDIQPASGWTEDEVVKLLHTHRATWDEKTNDILDAEGAVIGRMMAVEVDGETALKMLPGS